jgi:hypothetical protein
MRNLLQPLHGIRQTHDGGWEVWSLILQYPVSCGSPADAKRIAAALEVAFPRGGPVDFIEVEAAIADSEIDPAVANLRL